VPEDGRWLKRAGQRCGEDSLLRVLRVARRGAMKARIQAGGQIDAVITAAAPHLTALPGIGVDTAGQLLVTAGDNPGRLRSERSFARLCGAAPIPVSSGPDRPASAAPRRRP